MTPEEQGVEDARQVADAKELLERRRHYTAPPWLPIWVVILSVAMTTLTGALAASITYIHRADLERLAAVDVDLKVGNESQWKAIGELRMGDESIRARLSVLETRLGGLESSQQQVSTKQDTIIDNQRRILFALKAH